MKNDEDRTLREASSVACDVLEQASFLIRRSPVLKPGEWAIQHCAFGRVLVGKWHDLGGGWIGCKPGECWTYRRWRGGHRGIGVLAQEGPSSGCILDAEPMGCEIMIGPGLQRRRCNEEVWEKWAKSGLNVSGQ
jgi:hypothetical protein